ncbi:ethanolamine kinase [Amyelois transitella]|uniref:ethanolamine kinase n=1 Tax=Amyelois transitella TaxID=680683 RepID=UPI00067D9CAE|nr:ethanolamine kinase [Amyelois transitella]XP_013185649.1 ethanolamine kinase [Amyelois transitella]
MSGVCLPAGDIYVSVKIEESDPYDGILRLLKEIRPDWNPENIKFKLFTDGITNKLVACRLCTNMDNDDNVVLVRIYGNKTDLLIDRTAEIRNIKTLHALGLAPEIYCIFENGLAYQYYPGVCLNTETVYDEKIWPLVARQMAKMHKVKLGPEIKQEPTIWDKTEQFMSLIPERFTDETKQKRFVTSLGSITKLRIEFERLKSHLTKAESPVVFAHNDLVLGNVIYNQSEGTVVFIDYEYAAYNFQAYDIANHFNEYVGLTIDDINYERYPNMEFQKKWIRVYLTEYLQDEIPTESDIQKVYKEVQRLTLASHFTWGVWSLVQYEHSTIDFDFGQYAEIRLNRYYEIKDQLLKEFS